jgi:HSP20 family protein
MYRTHTVFDDMYDMMRGFDRAIALPRRTLLRCRTNGDASFVPAVDCLTRENDFVVRAELPGIDPEKVEITVHEGRLVLSGEKNGFSGEDVSEFYVREASHGKFERAFTLPEDVKTDEISASYENGVLEIVIPKGEEKKPRRIEVS